MKIFDKDKPVLIDNPNLEVGCLKDIFLDVKTTWINLEEGGVEVTRTYSNGYIEKEIVNASYFYETPESVEYAQVYVPYTSAELLEKNKNTLRTKREPLLLAFDKWEKAVLRGREIDDPSVMTWYSNLLDLVESAFENVPERVKYYL